MRMTAARTEQDENSQKDILKKLRSYDNQRAMNVEFQHKMTINPRTTAASRPTICRTVNSEIRMVGRIQPKKACLAWASCGENPGARIEIWTDGVAEVRTDL